MGATLSFEHDGQALPYSDADRRDADAAPASLEFVREMPDDATA